MKTPSELAQEGQVKEAYDSILNPKAAATKRDPEEVARIFDEALRGMPPAMRKVIEGLSDDMKIKFVQKAMRGLKGASLDDTSTIETPVELAQEGRVKEAYDSILNQEVPVSKLALPTTELAKRGLVEAAYDFILATAGPDPTGHGWKPRGDRMIWDSPAEGITFTARPTAGGTFGLAMLYDGEVYSWRGNFESQEAVFEIAARLYHKLTRTTEADKYLKMFQKLATPDPTLSPNELAQRGQVKEAFEVVLATNRSAMLKGKMPGALRRYAIVDRKTGKHVAMVDAATFSSAGMVWAPKNLGEGEWLVFQPAVNLEGGPNHGSLWHQPILIDVTIDADGKWRAHQSLAPASDQKYAPKGYRKSDAII